MRILHIIGTLDPAAGGTSEAVRLLLTQAADDHTHEVVTLDAPDSSFLAAFPWPVHAFGPLASTFGYTPRLLPWLKANRDRFDGVVVNGLWVYPGYAAWKAFSGKLPYVVFTHGMLDPYFKRAFPRKHLKKWLYWLGAEYWILRGAYRVLFTCDAEARLAEQSFWLHHWTPAIVPLGTVAPAGDPAMQREAFLAVCPELRASRFLLFLGRIHPKKGCDLLVDAFVALAETDPELNLVMAGPDSQGLRETLEAGAVAAGVADRLHWPGMLQGEAKWGAFRACEAFVLPSHQENFGIAVVEALACGKPVLLSDKVNTASDIAADGAGLMEADTLAGTQRLLERWIAMSRDGRETMAQRAGNCFHTRYDMRENAKSVARLLAMAAAEAQSLSGTPGAGLPAAAAQARQPNE